MYLQSLLSHLTRLIALTACLLSVYLYLYPLFHLCAFPAADGSFVSSLRDTVAQHVFSSSNTAGTSPSLAPFRLLVLADPQLEGDTSLPKPEDGLVPKIKTHWNKIIDAKSSKRQEIVKRVLQDFLSRDVLDALKGLRKRIDLLGNDFYLAHIYRTLNWWSKPTHTAVLGDLIGSQWVSDDEFEWRAWRYWNRVLDGARRVDDHLITLEDGEKEKIFSLQDESWKNRIINIAGNHDIGYAGDISAMRMDRFERAFGKANWDVRFEYPPNANETGSTSVVPSIHMVVLNSLMLDTPALSEDLQKETYEYLNSLISNRVSLVEDRSSFTLLLTHLPLFKKDGVCVDPPFFDFWGSDNGGGSYKPHGLKEQNHLSQPASEPGMLESLFGMKGDANAPAQGRGRNGVILTGHDHEGCDVWHFIPVNSTYSSGKDDDRDRQTQWEAVRWHDADMQSSHTGVREVTLRSMMGEFSGNAGLLSAWFDFETGEWLYKIQTCRLGVQHIWWTIHIVDIVAVGLVLFSIIKQRLQRPAQPAAKLGGRTRSEPRRKAENH